MVRLKADSARCLRDHRLQLRDAEHEPARDFQAIARAHTDGKFEVFDYPGEYMVRAEGEQFVRTRLEELSAQHEVCEASGTTRTCKDRMLVQAHFASAQRSKSRVPGDRCAISAAIRRHEGIEDTRRRLPLQLYRACPARCPSARHAARLNRSCRGRRRRRRRPGGRRDLHRQVRPRESAVPLGPLRQEGREQLVLDSRLAAVGRQELGLDLTSRASGRKCLSIFSKAIPTSRSSPAACTTPSKCRRTSCRRNKTQSGFMTRSSQAAQRANANEIRFEDKKGAEQLWMHAEKNQDIEVENDETHWVGHDRKKTIDNDETTLVKHDRTETVGNNETISIGVNRTESVGSNETISIGANRTEDVGANETISIGSNRTITVGASETATVSLQRTHTVGINETICYRRRAGNSDRCCSDRRDRRNAEHYRRRESIDRCWSQSIDERRSEPVE